MKAFPLKPDRSTPPATLPPSMHADYVRIVKAWPQEKPWNAEAAIAEVVRRRADERLSNDLLRT